MSLTLEESSRLAGERCWIERRLFERLGSWVQPSSSVRAKRLLDRHSQHAAWRAAQWWDRLPVLADVDREDLVRPSDQLAALQGAIDAEIGDQSSDPLRLAVAYRLLLPRAVAGCRRHLSLADQVADSSTIRTLHQVLRDLVADWAEGETVLQEDMAAVDVVAVHDLLARLEQVASGA